MSLFGPDSPSFSLFDQPDWRSPSTFDHAAWRDEMATPPTLFAPPVLPGPGSAAELAANAVDPVPQTASLFKAPRFDGAADFDETGDVPEGAPPTTAIPQALANFNTLSSAPAQIAAQLFGTVPIIGPVISLANFGARLGSANTVTQGLFGRTPEFGELLGGFSKDTEDAVAAIGGDTESEDASNPNASPVDSTFSALAGESVGLGTPFAGGPGMGIPGEGENAELDIGADSGGGGGKIICAQLCEQGRIPHDINVLDQAFGRKLWHNYPQVMAGYLLLAKPIVKLMKKSALFSSLVHVFARPWSKQMACLMGARKERSRAGRMIMKVGGPICYVAGFFAKGRK